ncbi:hypothetical protein BN1708_009330 [Verticillium longisporum]|uniref:Uncharacterized protein n=1 Tax=Verticillium longisporum TaxID=100787 RepID=A0A0G4KFL7_VERLO|nr:hypothetical protein BN1708_009330 [Verticillium longisporum]
MGRKPRSLGACGLVRGGHLGPELEVAALAGPVECLLQDRHGEPRCDARLERALDAGQPARVRPDGEGLGLGQPAHGLERLLGPGEPALRQPQQVRRRRLGLARAGCELGKRRQRRVADDGKGLHARLVPQLVRAVGPRLRTEEAEAVQRRVQARHGVGHFGRDGSVEEREPNKVERRGKLRLRRRRQAAWAAGALLRQAPHGERLDALDVLQALARQVLQVPVHAGELVGLVDLELEAELDNPLHLPELVEDLVHVLGLELEVLPVADHVAQRAPHATPVLAKGPQDVEVRLRRLLTERLHRLGHDEARVLRRLDVVVGPVQQRAARQRHDGEVVVQ